VLAYNRATLIDACRGIRRMNRSRATIASTLLTLLCSAAHAFTEDQAAAGRVTYDQICARCHGANLRQLPEALLAGREFVAKWGNSGATELD
jgi:mono/diheme cytochrome c family protein